MQIQNNALVQYKKSPAVVKSVGDKIEILLGKDTLKRVRPKDIILLHSGPATLGFSVPDLPMDAVADACELLEGDETDLTGLTELIFGDSDFKNVFAVWQLVQQAVYFSGEPDKIISNGLNAALEKQQKIDEVASKKQQEADFLNRLKERKLLKEDFSALSEVEMLALMKRDASQLLKKISVKQSPQSAHQYLCSVGYWSEFYNPYIERYGVSEIENPPAVPDLPEEERRDLTHLESWAIDDEGNIDPDDAITFEGDKIWVHIADVSALVLTESELDAMAMMQMSNSYLPEKVVHMLPEKVTETLGLGLSDISPALSIGFQVSELGFSDIEITLSFVKVKRISYKKADEHSAIKPFFEIAEQLKSLRSRAVSLQFPEVKVSVNDDKIVKISELPPYLSRNLVMEFMLAGGICAGKFAVDNNIPFVFSTQALPDLSDNKTPERFSEMLALRKQMKRSIAQTTPEPHDGLGIDLYSQVTSPLRRYVDLVNHQQLRAFLQQSDLLDEKSINERINRMQIGPLKRLERESNLHWKCVFLMQNSDWRGTAFVMDLEAKKSVVIIPELALEMKIKRYDSDKLDDEIQLKISKVDLSELLILMKRI